MGETKNHVTRSAVPQLGWLLSPLLSASFSSTAQPHFPLHGTSHKNWAKMPVSLMCDPGSNNWSGETRGVFLLLDPAARDGEKTPDDGQRWCLGPGAVLIPIQRVVMSTFTLCSQYFLKGMEVSYAMSYMGWGTDSHCKTKSGFVEAGDIP